MEKYKSQILYMLLGALIATSVYMIAPRPKTIVHVESMTTLEETTTLQEETSTAEVETLETIIVEEPTTTESKKSLGEYKITAYCPCSKCCGKWANGITSTGVTATEGRTIAVDPSVIPYGSIVEINGNRYVAEDCGGAIKKNRIDIYFNSHEEALKWGVQYHDVYLITE
jgi:3D (Asp-Asp-Asp) domain-containing protein